MKIKYEETPVEDLNENSWNPNQMDESDFNHLVREIKRVGCLQPILVDKGNLIIDGAHRLRACMLAGLKIIPVIRILDKLSETEKQVLTINMNKIKGVNEPKRYAELLAQLLEVRKTDELMGLINMSNSELAGLLSQLKGVVEDDYAGEPPAEPVSKHGDLIELQSGGG